MLYGGNENINLLSPQYDGVNWEVQFWVHGSSLTVMLMAYALEQ